MNSGKIAMIIVFVRDENDINVFHLRHGAIVTRVKKELTVCFFDDQAAVADLRNAHPLSLLRVFLCFRFPGSDQCV